MRLAPAGALGDLGPLVLGDHALELDHQLVLGRLCPRALQEADLGAGPGELVDEQGLVGVAAGQAVGRVAEDDIDGDLDGEVPEALQGGADQGGSRVALVLEDPVGGTSSPQRSAASISAAVWEPIVCSSRWRAEDTRA